METEHRPWGVEIELRRTATEAEVDDARSQMNKEKAT
jgi:hypothetical protein